MAFIDPEKVPDAPLYDVRYAGALLSSRYGKKADFESMMAAVDWIADHQPAAVALISKIFCDTKACADYSVECRTTSQEATEWLADFIARAFYLTSGGYNGLRVESASGKAYRDPDWDEARMFNQ